jgi:hypothetical protein
MFYVLHKPHILFKNVLPKRIVNSLIKYDSMFIHLSITSKEKTLILLEA